MLGTLLFGLPLWAWLLGVAYLALGTVLIVKFDLFGALWDWWWKNFREAPTKVGGLMDTLLLVTLAPAIVLLAWAAWVVLLAAVFVFCIWLAWQEDTYGRGWVQR